MIRFASLNLKSLLKRIFFQAYPGGGLFDHGSRMHESFQVINALSKKLEAGILTFCVSGVEARRPFEACSKYDREATFF